MHGPSKDLPQWDLSQYFYASPDDPQIQEDLKAIDKWANNFRASYGEKNKIAGIGVKRKTKVQKLSPTRLAEAIDEYHAINDTYAKLWNYIQLIQSIHIGDTRISGIYDMISEKLDQAIIKVQFFENEVVHLDERKLEQVKANTRITPKHKYWVEQMAGSKPRWLHEETENVLLKLSPVLEGFYNNWEELDNKLRFSYGTQQNLTRDEINDRVNTCQNEQERRQAFEAYREGILPFLHIHAGILDKVLKYDDINSKIRQYKHHETAWNEENEIRDGIPQEMTASIKASGIEQRFYKLKAKMLGKTRLDSWDITAPAVDSPTDIPWETAQKIIVRAFWQFHPKFGMAAKRVFDEHRIDAKPRPNKYSGAFATDGSAAIPSHILINYRGSYDDLAYLAHEVGHAVAFQIARENQNNFLDGTSMLIAETASTLGEELLFKELARRAKTPADKYRVQMYKTENTMASLARAHDYEFILGIHKSPEQMLKQEEAGDLAKWFSKAWTHHTKERFGNTVVHPEKLDFKWATYSHIYSDPFYLGDYPMTNLIVRRLFDTAEKEGKLKQFSRNFVSMLEKGGTVPTGTLLNGLGFHINQPTEWKKALNGVVKMVDKTEALWTEAKKAPKDRKFQDHVENQRKRAGGGRGH